ncbi:chemotaxis protein CheD [Anatilimnocola floriformis]|uniref:chemotaxis protein CheD n=1 Tax=Anatilimnocola floriformis TaxID=2948575 RepID=UPI0020C4CBA1|nr:chemotaxis protein CheD [Anatilimnocola floriformis]
MTCSAPERRAEANVGMAQIALVAQGEIARAVLGSCIGLVLFHELRKTAVVAHIVLPQGQDRPGPAGKFADTALPEMLAILAENGIPRTGLVAKVAGGANMFGSSGPLQIGKENHAIVIQLLKNLRIPIMAEHVGGKVGRRITFDSATGDLQVDMAGSPSVVL